jgi:hypothetical protein
MACCHTAKAVLTPKQRSTIRRTEQRCCIMKDGRSSAGNVTPASDWKRSAWSALMLTLITTSAKHAKAAAGRKVGEGDLNPRDRCKHLTNRKKQGFELGIVLDQVRTSLPPHMGF